MRSTVSIRHTLFLVVLLTKPAFATNESILKCAAALMDERTNDPYSLIRGLQDSLLWTMERNGYVVRDAQGNVTATGAQVASFIERSAEPDAKIAEKIVRDAYCEICARHAPPGTPATRAGVDQHEIAQTLRDVAKYLQGKNIGKIHSSVANEWLRDGGVADTIERVSSQKELQSLFGAGDGQAYWPGKLVATLVDTITMLKFFAHLESLGVPPGVEAQKLIDRIEAFRGSFGSRHLSVTGMDHERYRFIEETPRHPSETFSPPAGIQGDIFNSLNVAFNWSNRKWLPTPDGRRVEWAFRTGGQSTYSDSAFLARQRATILEGFRRAGISAEVSVTLGRTYGEDTIFVRLSVQDYIHKFVPVKTGRASVDASYPGRLDGIPKPDTFSHYLAWQPGRTVFYGPEGLYVAEKAALPISLSQHLDWLLKAEKHPVKTVEVPDSMAPTGIRRFYVFSDRLALKGDVVRAANRYWRDTDFLNERVRVLNEFALISNGVETTPETNQVDVSNWVEYMGTFYIPYSGPYHQAALQLIAKYGKEIDFVFGDQLSADVQRAILPVGYSYYTVSKHSLDDHMLRQLTASLNAIRSNVQSGGDGLIDLDAIR